MLIASYSTIVEYIKFLITLKSIIASIVSLFIVTLYINCVCNNFIAYSSIKGVKAVPSVFYYLIRFLVI
jgi:hypothetical protein